MKRPGRSPAPQPELNLTNLMDVILCILVVFLITAPLLTQGVKVELPRAQAPALDEKNSVIVSFDAARTIHIDGAAVPADEFPDRFRAAWGSDPARAVLIEGDRTVPYGLVLETVGAIRQAGATRVGFLTAPPDGK